MTPLATFAHHGRLAHPLLLLVPVFVYVLSVPSASEGSPAGAVRDMVVAARQGDEAAVRRLKDQVEATPKPACGDRKAARALNENGLRQLKTGSTEAAVGVFANAAQADPCDAEALGNLGYALLQSGRTAEALRALEATLQLSPARSASWGNVGEAYAALDDESSAVAAFRLAYLYSRSPSATIKFLTQLTEKPGASTTLVVAARTARETPALNAASRHAPPVQALPVMHREVPPQPALPPSGAANEDDENFDAHTIRAADIPRDAPRFEQFPPLGQYKGRLAEPDVRSHPQSRLYRTMIRQGAKQGPNFAGHYTIVGWGCGTDCGAFAIVDANTGKVFHPPEFDYVHTGNVAYDEFGGISGGLHQYRPDSRLLMVIGANREESAQRGIAYFLWEGETLRRIRFVHRPYE